MDEASNKVVIQYFLAGSWKPDHSREEEGFEEERKLTLYDMRYEKATLPTKLFVKQLICKYLMIVWSLLPNNKIIVIFHFDFTSLEFFMVETSKLLPTNTKYS